MKLEKEHSKETLMSWKKEQLVEHIQCLEHNVNALNDRFDIQFQNYINLLKEERISLCEEIKNHYAVDENGNEYFAVMVKGLREYLDQIKER